MRRILLPALCWCFLITPAFAYRPFTTEDAGVAGKGVLQTEISYDYFKWRNGDRDQIFLLVSPIYGPTERLELSVETPYVVHHTKESGSSEGAGDINLVAKYVILWQDYEKKDAFFTMKGIAKLDTGNFEKKLGRGDVEYSIVPVITRTLGEFLTVHGQFGYTFVTKKKDGNLKNYLFYGLALDWAVTEPFHFVTECNVNTPPNVTQGDQKISLFGFTYEVSKHLILDVSFKKGLSTSSPKWGVGVGAAIEF